ncbi:MAG: hypothetical protein K2X93_25800 [Candidatus Obscuribacterales bacterium]|nr:hypothetical protein [Candidatus Obscuribacterales bacterium]
MGSSILENTTPSPESDTTKPTSVRYTTDTPTTTPTTETKDTKSTNQQGGLFLASTFGPFGDAPADPSQQPAKVEGRDGTVGGDRAPLNINDINDIPIFFVLDNRPNTGQKLAPPVGLHDSERTTPLQITDAKGRVIATDSGSKDMKWSVSKNPETGNIETINYPDGKVRTLKHEGNQLSRIETVEKGTDGKPSRTVFTRDAASGKWYAEIGGLKAELPGDIQFSKDGVLSFQMDNQGKWRSERPDGTSVIERTIQSGARVAFNEDNTVQTITRPDQTKVSCVHTKGELTQIEEMAADGKSVSWTKSGDKWVSNTKPPQERTKFEVNDNGNVSYVTADNVKHTITGGGMELNQKQDGSEFQFDKEGRFTDLKDVNGLKVRGIEYHPETGQVTKAQVGTPESGRIFIYEREGTSNVWKYTVTDGSGTVVQQDRWNGDISVGKDGTYAYKEDPKHGRNADGLWAVFKLDGTQYLLQDNGKGSQAIFDMNRNLLAMQRENGTKLEVNRTNGFATVITETGRDGKQVKYVHDPASGTYIPDKAGARPIKKLEATGNGVTKITDINGSVQSINLDGSSLVKNDDGSTSEVDNQGRVMRTTSKGGDVVRAFNWDSTKLVSVSETRKAVGDKNAPGETRTISGKDMSVLPDGTIKYVDADGQKLSTTSDGSWQAWQNIKGKDYLVRAVNPKGYMRTIVRDGDGEATSMTDSKPTDKGQQVTEEFRRVNENGKWSDSWAKVDKDGKIAARHNVRLLDNGTYNYIDSAGKDKLAKVGDRGWESGFSDSVDEARARLTELMDSHLEESQKKRFQIILDRFEKRGKERVEAQVAGGLDGSKSQEEWDQKIAKTYDHLANMLNPNAQGATYDVKTRAKLVENAAFAMACPVKANDQGNWGCCWMISGVYAGVIQYPDKMASMLQQLSMTGKFTDVNGKTWSPPKNLLQFTNQGNSWTIENCGKMGQRSPVSEIWTSVAAYLSEDGRRMDRGSRGGSPQGCNHAMKLITGDTWKVTGERSMTSKSMQQELLRKGAFVCIMPGHMYLGALEKHGNDWQLVASLQHGDGGRRVNGIVSDLRNWTVRGSRGRYSPDINLPGMKDKPIGPNRGPQGWDDGGGGGGGWRPRRWRQSFNDDIGSCGFSGAAPESLLEKYRKQMDVEDQERRLASKQQDQMEDYEESIESGRKLRTRRRAK